MKPVTTGGEDSMDELIPQCESHLIPFSSVPSPSTGATLKELHEDTQTAVRLELVLSEARRGWVLEGVPLLFYTLHGP